MKNYVFTSESVSEGHPDKLCDQVSDSIVDLYLSKDPEARTAVECFATTNYLLIGGEVRGPEDIKHDDIERVARQKIKEIGYDDESFHHENVQIDIRLHQQSADIAQGVDEGTGAFKEEGAGDQGIMFGYACKETPELMPAPISYAHKILRRLAEDRQNGKLSMLGPDSKSQVTLSYEDGQPVSATKVLVSTQHEEGLSQAEIREIVRPYIETVLPEGWMCAEEDFFVNPTGKFVIGGPHGDAGLTGRKIIVDTYGGAAPHGGGAFSGKDPTKVDRSAAYASRYLAKNIVAADLADKCTIQLAYAIGVSQPLGLFVNTHETGKIEESTLATAIRHVMDLSPKGIRTHLGLNKPIYERTAAYGHFGRTPREDGHFSWERTDLVDALTDIL